jgi:tRNA A-37 threonylcarbamoyl transferase component Bud32
MSLNLESLQIIAADPRWRVQRVARIDTPDGPVLVKGQRPARGPLRFKVMQWLSQLTGNPLLQPVPAHGGARAQNTEVQRLKQLAAAGLSVPAVLHQAPDYIALQFLPGESLQNGLTQTPDLAMGLFEQGLLAIRHVHQQGQYLSQAFARNIMVSSGQLWFIDFEDDPLEVMDVLQAQTRDWLAYLLSTIWMANAPQEALLQSWHRVFEQLDASTQKRLVQSCDRLVWLRHLSNQRKPWGRDVITLQALGDFLDRWRTHLYRA